MAKCDCGTSDDWVAWHDRMPGSTPTLHVVGICRCPTPGYTLALRRGEPQGTNANDLLLELVTTGPFERIVPQVIVPVLVSYEEETDFAYETVSIVPDGPSSIPVKPVS